MFWPLYGIGYTNLSPIFFDNTFQVSSIELSKTKIVEAEILDEVKLKC